MLIILNEAEVKKKYYGGAPNKLSLEDIILMTLEYWREYRTYFHIGLTYGISEANCYRNIRWIEDTLIKHPKFQLLREKKLLKDNFKDKTIMIDATESSIQRPKKTKKILLSKKEKTHNKNTNHNLKR